MKSRGGIEDGQSYTSRKTVTVLAADPLLPPTVTKVKQAGKPDGTVYPNVSTTVNGTNLAGATVKLLGQHGETAVDKDVEILSAIDTELVVKVDYTTGGQAPQNFRFKVTTAGGSVEFPITWEE